MTVCVAPFPVSKERIGRVTDFHSRSCLTVRWPVPRGYVASQWLDNHHG